MQLCASTHAFLAPSSFGGVRDGCAWGWRFSAAPRPWHSHCFRIPVTVLRCIAKVSAIRDPASWVHPHPS